MKEGKILNKQGLPRWEFTGYGVGYGKKGILAAMKLAFLSSTLEKIRLCLLKGVSQPPLLPISMVFLLKNAMVFVSFMLSYSAFSFLFICYMLHLSILHGGVLHASYYLMYF